MFEKWIVLVFLFLGMIWDIKKRVVPKTYIYIFFVAGTICLLLGVINEKGILDGLFGLIPGCVVIMLSIVSREHIGSGDGWILLCVGFFQNVKETLCMIFFAFAIMTIVLMFLLVIRRISCKSTIPLVPFLFVGQAIIIVGGYI